MFKARIRGVFDPITMGFVLALAGMIAVYSLDAKAPSESTAFETPAVTESAN